MTEQYQDDIPYDEEPDPNPPGDTSHVSKPQQNKKTESKTITPAKKIDSLRATMGSDYYQKQISNYFNNNRDEAMRFLTASVEYVRRTPKLLNCDTQSLATSFMTLALFRFMPSIVSGEAYIIPYGNEAKFQLGYQGLVTLLHRSSKISHISSNVVFEKDAFDYEEGLEPRLSHRPAKLEKDRGKPVAVYTVVTMADGNKSFYVMSSHEVMQIKDMSPAKNKKDSPWNSKDPGYWMWKKTCLIQHSKLLPKTDEVREAIKKDYEGEGVKISEFDVEGPATAPANHEPDHDNTNE